MEKQSFALELKFTSWANIDVVVLKCSDVQWGQSAFFSISFGCSLSEQIYVVATPSWVNE
jgi:hypothetical protein